MIIVQNSFEYSEPNLQDWGADAEPVV